MSIAEEYRNIYNRYVSKDLKQELAIYEIEQGINNYQPLSHNCRQKCLVSVIINAIKVLEN